MWLLYKREKGQLYKTDRSFKSFFKTIEKESQGNPSAFQTAVEQSVKNNWSGVFPMVDHSNKITRQHGIDDGYKRSVMARLMGSHPAVDNSSNKEYNEF